MTDVKKDIKRRNKDWVQVTFFVFLDDADKVPSTINLRQHSLEYLGAKTSRKHLTGVYGTNSRDTALFLASSWADANGKSLLMIDAWTLLPNFHVTRSQITREIINESHWMHSERLNMVFKEELYQKALKWALRNHGEVAHREAIHMSMPNFLLKYPEFAMKILDDEAELHMIVHPVHASFDLTDEKAPFWAATVHLDRANIVAASVRHMPEVEVSV